mmetsp:Transcript_2703/g.3709  ORF Transcript_2703/g.3709 Transcript_2703/m.3709 type:complete len:179 (+) Transcript_2703:475-1011(+)|eukprot:CAMPEP_0185619590 /NCGR_PEP_ID=MMETSP0436-20130131/51053_1 /TAXON_ID=626734 ORGANISM="Favella taraikaensis, Strain Fe Narragansett Bay" /NCGR_SAMPLE_ID=MMETSP0436 /ASSEMBLY_ACC=CAM_ASM_000390 /LENGTH=178 /DNA_ID=CAMNT_0028259173 /DNA_START=34 /DNA_END=570 /DNA_ORIENTATION=-
MQQKGRKTDITIEHCLQQFRTPEHLSSDDTWYCSKCKTHRDCVKQMELYRAAPILIFSFNRFKSHNVLFNEKMNDRIKFPIEGLDLSSHVKYGPFEGEFGSVESEGLLYDLQGVITHYGSLDHGHYVAYANNSLTNSWYEYNDSLVTRLETDARLKSVLCDNAYVVFYKLRNFEQTVL